MKKTKKSILMLALALIITLTITAQDKTEKEIKFKVFGSSATLSVKLLFAHIKIIRVHNVSFLYKLVICSVGIFFGNHGVNGAVEHSRGQSMLYTFGVAKPNACSRKIL